MSYYNSIYNNGYNGIYPDYKYIPPGLERRLAYSRYIVYTREQRRRRREQLLNNKKIIVKPQIETDIVCSICYDEIPTNIQVKKLPCLHIFHSLCINKWTLIKKECPMCRYKL